MKALGLVVLDKKIFENSILKTYFLTPWPTFATNQNHLNNFGRGPPRGHSCEVWSKYNEWFQRRRCLSKKVYGRRMTDDARPTTTDDGQRPVPIAHPEHKVLTKWAKNRHVENLVKKSYKLKPKTMILTLIQPWSNICIAHWLSILDICAEIIVNPTRGSKIKSGHEIQ